ncbi:MAG: hypothetical protein EO766_17265 [Hydrotalea sp. AMD]|uniref:hypothetical protein n=1 Tax=Hydrotalea sp. AMD TaxID=2501297 RepID=UPI00102781A4|nr:hypothetical protein [Hydrotalea sp. AMD]RWZ84369.1 MAG: hypothetical protein EO766_17265 [Hydrotalea sp. AMD]
MINLYDYYSQPQELHEYKNRMYLVPMFAFEEIKQGNKDPKLPETIKKDPEFAVLYAATIIHGRWPEAEPFIMKDPHFARYYATDIIKDRWPEAEPYIQQDSQQWLLYKHWFKF